MPAARGADMLLMHLSLSAQGVRLWLSAALLGGAIAASVFFFAATTTWERSMWWAGAKARLPFDGLSVMAPSEAGDSWLELTKSDASTYTRFVYPRVTDRLRLGGLFF